LVGVDSGVFDMANPSMCREKRGHAASATGRICGKQTRSVRKVRA
jgi:hypothetical protein